MVDNMKPGIEAHCYHTITSSSDSKMFISEAIHLRWSYCNDFFPLSHDNVYLTKFINFFSFADTLSGAVKSSGIIFLSDSYS